MELKKYLFLIPAILFFIILFVKLIQLSKMIYLFPSYDFSSHLTNLYFLKQYGFHNLALNWYHVYGGDFVLRFYPPGIFFFSLIFYSFISNIQLSFYLAFIFLHLIGFFGILLLGKVLKFSYTKIFFLFSIFYANPLTIPWFYFNGRLPEMFAWTISFYFLNLIFYYKDKILDYKFYTLLTFPAGISETTFSFPFSMSQKLLYELGGNLYAAGNQGGRGGQKKEISHRRNQDIKNS